jgi:hypothetical protein
MRPLATRAGDVEIHVEPADAASAYERTGAADQAVRRSAEAFETALQTIRAVSRSFAASIDAMEAPRPESYELSFGVKFSASGDVWLAKAAAEAHLVAKVTWKSSSTPRP